MQARLLRAMTGLLLLAVLIWLAEWMRRGEPAIALLGTLVLIFPHAPILALEFALLRSIGRDASVPEPTRADLLRAWWAEVLAGWRVFAWQQPYRSRRHPDDLKGRPNTCRGVVLVHGFMCNRGFWNRWLVRLSARGIPVVAVDLEPVFGPIDEYARLIAVAVGRVAKASGSNPVIVAHSMGGLAVRAWLRDAAAEGSVHRVVTIASPHGGTRLARFGLAHNVRQMRPDADWLTRLAESETPSLRSRFTCFYSHCDNIVFPASCATLKGAENRHLRGRAHVDLVDHPEVFATVMGLLETPSRPELP